MFFENTILLNLEIISKTSIYMYNTLIEYLIKYLKRFIKNLKVYTNRLICNKTKSYVQKQPIAAEI